MTRQSRWACAIVCVALTATNQLFGFPSSRFVYFANLARAVGATGVGYYPTVQFVHVDVRPVPYFWTDTSGHTDRSHGDDERADSPETAGPVVSSAGD